MLHLALLFASLSPPDTWAPFADKRVVDPTGTHYVVVRAPRKDGEVQYGSGAAFVVAVADPDMPLVEDADDRAPGGTEALGPRAEDEVLGRGELPELPVDLLFSATGLGFCAIEKYANMGYGRSLVSVAQDGAIRFVKKLEDLFTRQEIESMPHTVSSIFWYRGAWIDEERGEVVLAGGPRLVAVDLKTGEVETAGDERVRDGLLNLDARGQQAALAVARKTLDEEATKADLSAVLADVERGISVRLRAAVALGVLGDRSGGGLLREAASKPRLPGVSPADRAFALRSAPRVFPAGAIPFLIDALSGARDDGTDAARDALVAFGAAAVPALMDVLGTENASESARVGAAEALGRIGTPDALDALEAARAGAPAGSGLRTVIDRALELRGR